MFRKHGTQPPYSCRVSSCAMCSYSDMRACFHYAKLINTKVRIRLDSKNLDAMLRIILEGPDEEIDDIVGDVTTTNQGPLD